MERTGSKRDLFAGKWGFILACIGSAVGMGNIWLFPRRVAEFGAPFLVAYLLCVVIIGFSGVAGEMAFGRAMKKGPMGAFEDATLRAGKGKALGGTLSMVPVLGSLALAVGYSVVVGWILKYLVGSFTGSALAGTVIDDYLGAFGTMATGHAIAPWHILALVITFTIVIFGISGGIERVNKVFMPLFFLMFVGIAIYVATLEGAMDGYRHMFVVSDWSEMLSGRMWKYALGQAFFSLSLAGSGTLVYGSYLKDKENIPFCAMSVAIFDTLAAFVAALAIIPAMSTAYNATGAAANEVAFGGPGLLFAYLPLIFKNMPGGQLVMIVFFVAVTFAGLSSLINLFEAPIEALQTKLGFGRKKAVLTVGVAGSVVAILIEGIVSGWMDVCSIYLCPIGALLAAIMFFWVCGKEFVTQQINLGSNGRYGSFIASTGKYVFCGLTILVLVLGTITSGGIG